MVQSPPVMTLSPTFKALSISVAEASIASTIPEVIPPELVIKIALSTMVEPEAEVSTLSRSRRASVLRSTAPVFVERALLMTTKLSVPALASLLSKLNEK